MFFVLGNDELENEGWRCAARTRRKLFVERKKKSVMLNLFQHLFFYGFRIKAGATTPAAEKSNLCDKKQPLP